MSAAFLPSPAHALWHLGPVPVRAYALCIVAGVVTGLWLTVRRYQAVGGQASVVLDLAVAAIPAGLVLGRGYAVLTSFGSFFGGGRDWVSVLRVWDGGLGLPGVIAGGALAAWLYRRRTGVAMSPLAGAAAPALAFAQAIGCWGSWFTQNLYGRPSTWPWAVEISPVHRTSGFASFATFQPIFLYESLWAAVAGVALIQAGRRLELAGDRLFACYVALYACGRLVTDSLRLGKSDHLFGLRVSQLVMIAVLAAALVYLRVTRARRGPDFVGDTARPAARPRPSRLAMPPRPRAPVPAETAPELAATVPAARVPASLAPPLAAPVPPDPDLLAPDRPGRQPADSGAAEEEAAEPQAAEPEAADPQAPEAAAPQAAEPEAADPQAADPGGAEAAAAEPAVPAARDAADETDCPSENDAATAAGSERSAGAIRP